MSQSVNHSMFWRVWLRSLAVKRPQSALAFAALALGATVASLLLNVYSDARRKMQDEFRSYGPNVILALGQAQSKASDPAGNRAALMDASVVQQIEASRRSLDPALSQSALAPVLYAVVLARPGNNLQAPASSMVAAGSDFATLRSVNPAWKVTVRGDDGTHCFLGGRAAERLGMRSGDSIALSSVESPASGGGGLGSESPLACQIAGLVSSGGAEDDQVFLPLATLQRIARLPGRISLVEMRVPGTSSEVEQAVRSLARDFPDLEVRPVREIVQSEGRVLTTLRALIVSLAALIIGVVGLCVMATVTTIVLERRKEIAVMKALGASERTVFGLLITEIGALGIAGGLVGFVLGALLARRVGLDLFGVALSVDWATLLPVVAAAALVAAAPALVPVSSVRSVDPARVLRGE
ncbi:MAG TPA: FtsX-like permease family protein [Terriglobia bacterium]|nr:FtsX-like permease family protein [Terriglobia bacterium]